MVGRTLIAVAVAGIAWVSATAGAAAAACHGEAAEASVHDPIDLYGPEYRLAVYRDGTRIGTHAFRFSRDGDDLKVDIRFEAEVKFLFFTAFRYLYTSESVWRDACLVRLRADTDDDGDASTVEARLAGDGLRISGPEGLRLAEPGLMPTDHWNAAVLGRERVLNTITGSVAEVRIVEQGEIAIDAGEARLAGRRYVYEGDLSTEVWYDADGRWLGMRYRGKDGSTIEHVCEACTAPAAPAS